MRLLICFLLVPFFAFSAETRILVLGDSNSYGVPERESSWVSLLKQEYKNNPDLVFLNYAVGFSTIEQCEMIHIIASEIHNPHIVIYTGGLVNVLYQHNLQHLELSLRRTLNRCHENNQIVLFGMIDFTCLIDTFNHPIDYISEVNQIYTDVPLKYNVIPFLFLDHNLLAGDSFNSGDNVHPNLEGQKLIAKRVKEKLEFILKRGLVKTP